MGKLSKGILSSAILITLVRPEAARADQIVENPRALVASPSSALSKRLASRILFELHWRGSEVVRMRAKLIADFDKLEYRHFLLKQQVVACLVSSQLCFHFSVNEQSIGELIAAGQGTLDEFAIKQIAAPLVPSAKKATGSPQGLGSMSSEVDEWSVQAQGTIRISVQDSNRLACIEETRPNPPTLMNVLRNIASNRDDVSGFSVACHFDDDPLVYVRITSKYGTSEFLTLRIKAEVEEWQAKDYFDARATPNWLNWLENRFHVTPSLYLPSALLRINKKKQ